MSSTLRQVLLVAIAGIVMVVVGIPQIEKLAADRDLLKPYDFVQYWSAGRQLLDGRDAYDPDQLIPLQRNMYDGVRKAIMMWNPPYTLPLTLPFAALPWRLAQFLWLGMQLGAVLLSADLFWRIYGGDPSKRWISWLLALTFAPTLFLLLMGQISGLLLLGLSGFLYFHQKERPALAGCFAALTSIKPHLFALFALVLLLESIRDRKIRRSILAGGTLLLVASILPMLWNVQVWQQYVEAMRRPPSDTFETMREFEHPTIGFRLRQMLPGQPFAAQFIPVIIALIAIGLIWWRDRQPWLWTRRMPMLILVAALTAGYGAWAFDLVILLLPLVPIAVCLSETKKPTLIAVITLVYLILNFLVLRSIQEVGSQSNPWITPVVLVAYAIAVLGGCRSRDAWKFG
ncbi:MAG: DUF2029 domain-containing protein [Planctomycetes bacterium]|nr:DUF2029 domain-containing protein [Planctomycetota bacterium]